MTSIWIRAEQRSNEQRVGVTPDVVDSLISAGFNVIIERDQTRAIPIQQFKNIKIVRCRNLAERTKRHHYIWFKRTSE